MKTKLTLLALALGFAAFTGTASAHDHGGHGFRGYHNGHGYGHGHRCGHWYGGRWIESSYEVDTPVVESVETVETYAAPTVVDTEVVVEDSGVDGYYSNGVWYRGHGHYYGHGRGFGHGRVYGRGHHGRH